MSQERVIVLQLPDIDFAQVFTRLTRVVPHVEVLGPGRVVMLARGPARFYGSEAQAASALTDFARAEEFLGARVGIADGRFAAEIAARSAPADFGVVIVPAGASAEFLRDLPVSRIGDERLGEVLPGLGIYTLGAFAALPEDAVRARFGPVGVRAHRHARGEDADRSETVQPDAPQPDFERGLDFESPVAGAEQLAFAVSGLADQLSSALTESRLVCTTLRITLTDDSGARYEREWVHPKFFTAADMLSRLRWQADAIQPGDRTEAGIESVRLFPARTARAATMEPGLWSTGVDERVHHHVSRAQGLLGPHGVSTASLEGGRLLRDRQRFTAWGDAAQRSRNPGPWPGSLSAPTPTLVFAPPLRAALFDELGVAIRIDADDLLSAVPATLRVERYDGLARVSGWSRPWPIREHWWAGRPQRFRIQLELLDGDAWVVLAQQQLTDDAPVSWFAEGRYD